MEKIFCILGKSSVGKDSLVTLVENDLGMKSAVSFTTRPMREGEVEGKEYFFISDEDFRDLHGNNMLAEYTTYHVADNSTWYYGLTREELEKSKYVIVIVNPHGLEQLKEIYGDKVISILVDCDDMERLQRSIKRDAKANPKELCRRFLQDMVDFETVKCDYVVYNTGLLLDAVDEVKRIIKMEMSDLN